MVDDGVRVLLKAGFQGCFEVCELAVGFRNDAHQRPHSGPVCVGDPPRSGELAGAEPFLYSTGSRIEGAASAGGAERGPNLGDGQAGTPGGGGCPTQHGDGVAISPLIEGFEGCGVVLAQGVADLVGVTHPSPDQVLMRPSQDFDPFGFGAITGNPTMVVPVGAY